MSVTDLKQRLPDFLDIGSEVTGDPAFSMFNLSLKEKWENNKNFCHSMKDSNSDLDSNKTIQDAMERLDLNKSSYQKKTIKNVLGFHNNYLYLSDESQFE